MRSKNNNGNFNLVLHPILDWYGSIIMLMISWFNLQFIKVVFEFKI